MSFRPKSGKHAIVEVVFGFVLSRPFSDNEITAVLSQHEQWREWMPKADTHSGVMFRLGPNGPEMKAGGVAGVSFERIAPDGSLEWRLRLEGNNIFVNCLVYSRWTEVWGRVRPLADTLLKLASADDNAITGLILQYIDVFEWAEEPKSCDYRQLFVGGSLIPPRVFSAGPWWHLHQGWFRHDEARLPSSRLLEKLHIDAVLDDQNRPTVKLDSYLAYDAIEPMALGKGLPEGSELEAWFFALHDLDKELLRSVLQESLRQRIGLDG